MKNIAAAVVLIFALTTDLAGAQTPALSYSASLRDFTATYRAQLGGAFPQQLDQIKSLSAADRSVLEKSVGMFLSSVESKSGRLNQLYQAVFIKGTTDRSLNDEMIIAERSLSFATEAGLRHVIHILNDLHEAKNPTLSKGIQERLHHLDLMTDQLNQGINIDAKDKQHLKMLMDIRVALPKQMLRLACSYLGRVCLLREPISDWLGRMGRAKVAQRPGSEFSIDGHARIKKLPPNALVIVVANHQDGVLDVTLPGRLSTDMHIDGGLRLLAHSSNYPGVTWMNQGNGLFFTDRGDWQKESISAFEADHVQNKRVGLMIYPEGLVSGTLSQFPEISKVGAFSFARKMAVRYAGQRPVYLAVLTSNIHDHMTNPEVGDLKLKLNDLVRVPTEPLVNPDPWIGQWREHVEFRFNSLRTRQGNITERKAVPGVRGVVQVTDRKTLKENFPVRPLQCGRALL